MSYTVNCSILLTDLPLLERPAAAIEFDRNHGAPSSSNPFANR